MTKLDNDTQKYLEMFHEPVFTEHDFIAFLLPLLYKNGIYQISEEQLAKKLYYYYKNKNYEELFREIVLSKGSLDKEVDIHNGLYQEKFFSGNIFCDSMRGEQLNLRYDPNVDLSYYEQKLSEDGITKIRKMAEELSIRKKIEQQSGSPLCIYGVNPNMTYTLVHGKNLNDLLSFELITDGDISLAQYHETKEEDSSYYESPFSPNEYRRLRNNKVANITLENASFAIKQGLCNNKIRYSILNTEIIDPELLERMMNMANRKFDNDDFVITEKKPYVRKLVLK